MKKVIPIIDISNLVNNGLNSPKSNDVIKQIKKACLDIGFFTVVGHGVSAHLINSILFFSKKFFQLPFKKKFKIASQKWNNENSNIYRGRGNVGIGTKNPTHKLDVMGNVNISNKLNIGGTLLETPVSKLNILQNFN